MKSRNWQTSALLWLSQFLVVSHAFSAVSDRVDDSYMPQKSHCFSCASFVYLPLWSQLMHHYYPPKNFTDRCWQPDAGIGVVPCNSACFTLVERIDGEEYVSEQHGVIRGCVDRLLLFGLDDDVRNVLSSYNSDRVCRHTDRKLLRLFPLSAHTDVVTFCSCNGDFCNEHDMLRELNSSNSLAFRLVLHLLLFIIFPIL
ncbi:unnamed protein product [Caenorhabditis sp. 36 PRJEB53466]|nr:unnamed protein product [Caenorhabditis sp. 36 PRJEB53466]